MLGYIYNKHWYQKEKKQHSLTNLIQHTIKLAQNGQVSCIY